MSQINYSLNNGDIFKPKPLVTLGERRFYLNNSRSKFVGVSLSQDFGFTPCIQISGDKNNQVVFTETEWEEFLTHQGIITNYFYSDDNLDAIDVGKFFLEFKQLPYCKTIKISRQNSSVYLAHDSICTLWELLPLISYRINMLKNQQFTTYFKILKNGLRNMDGDIINNAWNLLSPENNPNNENLSTILEFLSTYPHLFKKEIEN